MVKHPAGSLDAIFAALADPTRRAILERLIQGEAKVTEVAKPFNMSLPAISKHLRVLEHASLLNRRKEGRVHYLSLNAAPMEDAAQWLAFYSKFWEQQFDSLTQFLLEDE